MIEFAKITGEVENNYIEVTMRTGESLYAPLIVVGTDVTLPSEKWISEQKDNFLALVAYEKDIPESPMVIGFYPVKGAESETYNTVERLTEVLLGLIEQLLKAKVNTQIGPQPFLPDTIQVFNDLKTSIEETKEFINSIKL